MRPTLEKHSVIVNIKKNWVQVADESGAPATQVSLHLAYFFAYTRESDRVRHMHLTVTYRAGSI